MDSGDKVAFVELLNALAAATNRKCDEAMLLAYWLGLQDLSIDKFRVAVTRGIRDCKFMPAPVELRELSGECSPTQRAMLAWTSVSRAAGSVGSYRSVDFEDPVVNAVIRSLGGWPELLGRTGDDFDKWARQEFIKCYEAFCRAGVPEDDCRPLGGLQTTETRPVRVYVGYDVAAASVKRLQELRASVPSIEFRNP